MLNDEQSKKEWLHEDRFVQVIQDLPTPRMNFPQCNFQERICMLYNEQLIKRE